jgi:hypothetical protein
MSTTGCWIARGGGQRRDFIVGADLVSDHHPPSLDEVDDVSVDP